MEMTNKFNLPDLVVRAMERKEREYDRGEVDISITQLVSSPRIGVLRKKHAHEIVTDVTDNFWALIGSAIHHVFQMGAGPLTVTEERLFAEIDGWLVSGAADVQEYNPDKNTMHIYDYKFTAAYSVKEDGKEDWVRQLNAYAYLVRKVKGVAVDGLTIVAIIRDWSRHMAAADPLYPQAPVIKISLPVWSNEEQEAYLRERVDLHRQASLALDVGLDLPLCSKEDQWERGASWAIKRKGLKRPTRVCSSKEEADNILSTMSGDYAIEFRPGKSVRCEGNYCHVSGWCSQYAQEEKEKQGGDVS